MKITLLAILFWLVLAGCYREDDLTVTPSQPEYDLSDSDTDPIQKERYKLYRDFGVILIDSVKPSDYRYNMTSSSPMRMSASLLDTAGKLEAIALLRAILYDAFPEEQVRNTPLKCILANKLYERYVYPDGGESRTDYEAWLSDSYFAFAITPKVLSNQKAKEQFTGSVATEFIIKGVLEKKYGDIDYMELFEPMFLGDADEAQYGFYVTYGEMHPDPYPDGEHWPDATDYPYADFDKIKDRLQEHAYENGLPALIVEHGTNGGVPNPAPQVDVYLREDKFLPEFLTWALLKSEEEKSDVLAAYPKFKQRFEVIQELLIKYTGIELK